MKLLSQTLNHHPQRGAKEINLEGLNREYRFLLYSRTQRADIKIIYCILEDAKRVIITDFFPTEMDNSKITKRTK